MSVARQGCGHRHVELLVVGRAGRAQARSVLRHTGRRNALCVCLLAPYARSATARGLGCHSMPGAALAGKISDLITTGTAPEFGSMAPMSM